MHDLHRYGTDLTALHVQGYLQVMLPVTFFALLSQEVAVKMTENKAWKISLDLQTVFYLVGLCTTAVHNVCNREGQSGS